VRKEKDELKTQPSKAKILKSSYRAYFIIISLFIQTAKRRTWVCFCFFAGRMGRSSDPAHAKKQSDHGAFGCWWFEIWL